MTRLSALAIIVTLAACVPTAADVEHWLDGVPDYNWYHGCAPTAGGMNVGYWDRQSEYENLYQGTAPLYADDADSPRDAIYDAIASDEHIMATYDQNQCTHDAAPNSLACFMHTDPNGDSGTATWNVATGMSRYAAWDNPETSIDESADFGSVVYYAPHTNWPDRYNQPALTFERLRWEIDQGRPLMLGLSLGNGYGHQVLTYGYRIDDQGDEWFAVRDTWQDGNSDGSSGIVAEMHDGQEWWRFDEHAGQSFGEGYYVDAGVPFVPDASGAVSEADAGDVSDDVSDAWTLHGTAEVVYASLAESDRDWYRVWLDEGEQFVAMTQDSEGYADTIDTLIRLYDPDGQYLRSSNDTFGIPDTTLMWWEADAPGWWSFSLEAGGINGTGAYALNTYMRGHAPEPGTLVLVAIGIGGLIARRRRGAAHGRDE